MFSVMPYTTALPKKNRVDPKTVLTLWFSVGKQLDCLMRHAFYYYDLKPENVLSVETPSHNPTRSIKLCHCVLCDLDSIWSPHYSSDGLGPIHTYDTLAQVRNWFELLHAFHCLHVKVNAIVFLADLYDVSTKLFEKDLRRASTKSKKTRVRERNVEGFNI